MTRPPTLRLRKRLEDRLAAGHPWIYRDALEGGSGVATGSVVDVVGGDGCFVARGLYDARSPIAVRVATLEEREAIDARWVAERVAGAVLLREVLFSGEDTDAFRLIHGEGDRLPGVVADRYGTTIVLQLDGDAARAWRDPVSAALAVLPGIVCIYERSRGYPQEAILGPVPREAITIREHGVRFAVDVVRGQKTGFFLDQRENRREVRRFARGRDVLNLFAYTGGFSVNAALAGASRVTSVDSAAPALAAARDNFALNGIDPTRHVFATADAFAWLADAVARGDRYDLVVVDPPSFAPSERVLGPALEKYRELNALALAVTAPFGFLVTASCSSHVRADAFLDIVSDASVRARRPLRVLDVRGQPADHPSIAAFPEGRYLKLVIAEVGGERAVG